MAPRNGAVQERAREKPQEPPDAEQVGCPEVAILSKEGTLAGDSIRVQIQQCVAGIEHPRTERGQEKPAENPTWDLDTGFTHELFMGITEFMENPRQYLSLIHI